MLIAIYYLHEKDEAAKLASLGVAQGRPKFLGLATSIGSLLGASLHDNDCGVLRDLTCEQTFSYGSFSNR